MDLYTTNSVLDAKLDEVTWSIFAGDLGVDIATALIPGSFLVSTSSMVESLVWDSPRGDLLVRIEQSLLGLDIDQDTVDHMLRHKYYPLSYQTVLVATLESLADVDGLPEIMPLVLSVTTVDQARFLVYTLRMLAKYHQDVARLETLHAEDTVVAIDKKGRLIITAPLDYISWSPELDQFSQRERFQRHKTHLYVTRELSKLARQELRTRGWSTYENSPLFESLVTVTR